MLLLFACAHSTALLDKEVSSESSPTAESEHGGSPSEASGEPASEASTEPAETPCGGVEELPTAPEGLYLPQGSSLSQSREECTQVFHASAGARGSLLSVKLDSWEGEEGAVVQLETLLGEPLVEWTQLEPGGRVEVELPQSGEFFIRLAPVAATGSSNSYGLSVSCEAGCELGYTRYPIFFMHGLAGFDSLLNVMDYWVGVEDLLVEAGFHPEIHSVSAFDTTVDRAEEWRQILETLKAEGVGRRFNLIGHSQGGLDARFLTTVLDDPLLIASITSIATPHNGTAVADAYTGAISLSPWDGGIIDSLFDFGAQVFGTSGDQFTAQLEQMTTASMETFNASVPDLPEISYYSWSGKSCRYIQLSCQSELDGETVSSYFLLSHAYIEGLEGDNDGLVSVQSSVWGTHLGVLNADHMDEVGHRFDLSQQPFNAAEFYLSEAERLFEAGF